MFFFFSSRRRHTRCSRDWSSDVCSSDLLGDLGGATGPLAVVLLEEVVDEEGDVRAPLAQRGHDDGDDLEPVEEVLAEVPGLDLGRQLLVGGGDYAHVDLEDAVGADRADLAVLE